MLAKDPVNAPVPPVSLPAELKTMAAAQQLAKTLYGFVYLWRPTDPAKPAVIIKRSFFNKFDSVCCFDDPRREITVLRQLSGHPHMIKYYWSQTNRVDKYWDLHMEYAAGGDMFDATAVTKTGFPEAIAKAYLRQILTGLEFLHVQQQLSHMDLSLENLLLVDDPNQPITHRRVVFTDFGSTIANKRDYRFLTQMRPGKTHYQAPEMHIPDPPRYPDEPCNQTTTIPSTTAVDIFAFGVIMFELLVAHPPFKNVRDKRYDVYFRKFGTVGYLLPAADNTHHASKEAIRIIDWCLQEKPENRPTVTELLALDYFMISSSSDSKAIAAAAAAVVTVPPVTPILLEKHVSV